MSDNVGVMIVSHSLAVASGTAEMVRQIGGDNIPISFAGGNADGGLGTDVEVILKGLQEIWTEAGIVVLYDLGSAEMSSEAAIEMLPEYQQKRIKICEAPLVEGAILAGVESCGGGHLEQVTSVAEKKQVGIDKISDSIESHRVTIAHPIGLHARPAVKFTQLAKSFEAYVQVKLEEQTVWVDAKSIVRVMGLKARHGKVLNLRATGCDAAEAVKKLIVLVDTNFGE